MINPENPEINTHRNRSYAETLHYLYDRLPVFHHVGGAAYKPGLGNTIRLMDALDNPQNQYRTIHVAGTNGKGSVSHFLAAILQQAGYKVGLYTSPHLVDFGERIRVNGEMIDQQYVVDFVAQQQALFSEVEPSFFEATMAMAFDYFAHCKVDVAVIEVGLGGRLDSTNILLPVLSVITNIGLDHVGFLGDTLEKIAYEKAGIIKRNIPVVIGESLPETQAVFMHKAQKEQAPIIFAEELFKFQFINDEKGKMWVSMESGRQFKIGLCGHYQLKNIATVVASVEQLKKLNFEIRDDAVRAGLELVTETTGLKGRWQILQQNPFVVADTGHNAAGIRWVVDQLKMQNYRTLRIVIGMVSDKDISTVLALLPKEAIYYFTQAAIPRALSASELMEKATLVGLKGQVIPTVIQAVELALKESSPNDFLFIGGSNFVVGEALPYFG
jgi:dihydrofolate synthase/folylpolyglutamate synthase